MYFNTDVLIASDNGNDTVSVKNAPAEQCSDNGNPSFGISFNTPSSDTHVKDNSATKIPNAATNIPTDIGSDVVSDISTDVSIDVAHKDTTSLVDQSRSIQVLQPSNESEYLAY